ncbi:MAG TPA: response regulator transcription factor [Solirubrobacteraceae bacterium]|nr:response regulator transcription factor [Solirubrobacteraceae bacterium]
MSALIEAAQPKCEEDAVASQAPIRLLVVDDHPAMRRGLVELLDDQPDFRVSGVACTAGEAMAAAGAQRFDVAVVDYHLTDRNGLWLSRRLNRLTQPPSVVIYSAEADGMLAAAAVAAKAHGLVRKTDDESRLCDAVRVVAGGGLVLPILPWQVSEVVRRRLDSEEQAIYGMLLAGFPVAEIGPMLGVSSAEVESYLDAMLRKLEPVGPWDCHP